MLKSALIVTSLGALAVVAALLLFGLIVPGLFVLGFWAAVAAIGLVFERFRYKPVVDAPLGPGWEPTQERFVDPSTGETLTVYYRAETGERAYVR
ncbi:MAG: hypothetical protein WA840_12960 [Caulobacteraceae bacterium]